MKCVSGKVLAGLMLLVGTSVVPACDHNDSSIFIQNVLAQQAVTPGQECKYTTDPTQLYISAGTLDTLLRADYSAVFLVGNQMVAEANPQTPTTETSTVRVEGAEVRITNATGAQLKRYTTPVGATLYPAIGSTPQYTPIGAIIVDQATAAGAVGTQVVTHTKFFGHTLGGRYIESDEFGFPVTVCSGCLMPIGCVNTATTMGMMPSTTMPVPCNIGQDDPLTCMACFAVVSPASACIR
jgi:hypothetical protein